MLYLSYYKYILLLLLGLLGLIIGISISEENISSGKRDPFAVLGLFVLLLLLRELFVFAIALFSCISSFAFATR